ncbi:MAG: multicopper oxidase domain-containing protein [Actinomycetota bacterium]
MQEQHEHHHTASPIETFPTDIEGLPSVQKPAIVDLEPGATYDLRLYPVTKRIGDATLRMLSYNGSIPGPTLRVKQGSEVFVNVTNQTEIEATVHWHGLRLENRFDGVPHETQDPIEVGGSYTHRLTFPDAGLFWYHPHIREDYAQEMGLYANVIVEPSDPTYWPPVHRGVLYTLDDVLIQDGRMVEFGHHGPNHVAMGRFGNVLLIGGETEQSLEVAHGEVLRFYLTNTANTRVFKVALPGARMKLVGADGGHHERVEEVDDVVLAPSERAIVDVYFDRSGLLTLEHVTPGRSYPLVGISVGDDSIQPSLAAEFDAPRTDPEMVAMRQEIVRYLSTAPDKTLAFVAEMDFEEPTGDGAVIYRCPMHPEVTSDEPGSCPNCGMKLMPETAAATPVVYRCPMHPEVTSDEPGKCPKCGMKLMPETAAAGNGHHDAHEHGHDHGDAMADGVEWEDLMPEVNRGTTTANMRWKLIDRDTGKENGDIDWTFATGDMVKIRLVNEMDSDHPMHHPFHIHGERFLVLTRDGVVEPNLVWKDTVLVRTGQVVEILMDASNPGLWMAHCHIAEHSESGMMFSFRVNEGK